MTEYIGQAKKKIERKFQMPPYPNQLRPTYKLGLIKYKDKERH